MSYGIINVDTTTYQAARHLYDEGKSSIYSLDTKENAVRFFKTSIGGKLLNEKFHEKVPYPDLDDNGQLIQNVYALSDSKVLEHNKSLKTGSAKKRMPFSKKSFLGLDHIGEPEKDTDIDFEF